MGDKELKELKEHVEVLGCADATEWAHKQALAPGEWTSGDLVNI